MATWNSRCLQPTQQLKGYISIHSGFNNYHNQSSIQFGEEKGSFGKEESTRPMKKKEPIQDRPVWNYNPKTAGKTTMVLGNEKTDYRKKDEVYKERTPTALTKSRKK